MLAALPPRVADEPTAAEQLLRNLYAGLVAEDEGHHVAWALTTC